MSYGLPVLSVNNYETKNNFINNKEILYYNDNDQLIKKILLLKNNKKISENISINSIIVIKKNFDWKKNTIKYTNLI